MEYQCKNESTDKKNLFKKAVKELVLTLNSRAQPYKINELSDHFSRDTGFIPNQLAIQLGFPSFENFVKYEKLKNYVSIKIDQKGEIFYLPVQNKKFKHIRDEQSFSYNSLQNKIFKNERDKYARAMLPENRPNVIEGKKRIIDILADLGGEKKFVCFQDIQNEYAKRFNISLSGPELKRLFQRSSASKIIIHLFANEIELNEHVEKSGMLYLKLKKSQKELSDMLEKYKISHEKLKKINEENKNNNFFDRRKRNHKKNLINHNLIQSILPPIPIDNDDKDFDFDLKEDQNKLNIDSSLNKLNKNKKSTILKKLDMSLESETFQECSKLNETTNDSFYNNQKKKKNDNLDKNNTFLINENNIKKFKWTKQNEKSVLNDSEDYSDSIIYIKNSREDEKKSLDQKNITNTYLNTSVYKTQEIYHKIIKKQALAFFISNFIFYRSPEATHFQLLINAVKKLDPNFETVLGKFSMIEFIQKYCASVTTLSINNTIVFGWHSNGT